MFEVLINSVDRTEYIKKGSLIIDDVLTSQTDVARFRIINKDYKPSIGDSVIINYGGTREFGGRITDVRVSDKVYREVEVDCTDWAVDLDRKKIAKVYLNNTAKEIIEDIIDTINLELGFSFTTNNVKGDTVFSKVVFNYLEASKCIESLASTLNYHWYIDAFQDIHFFAKGEEIAPFKVEDNSEDVIRETLTIDDSFSELRNRIIVRGGEFEGNTRSETYITDGSQITFNLAYRYANLPTVELDSVALDVGLENLDNDELEAETIDAVWDFNQKYLRFKNAPAVDLELYIEGNPLFPLVVVAESPESISEHGLKEHVIIDKSIKSTNYAIDRGVSDLEAYKDGVQSGSFDTYSHGLRSGQTISIKNTKLGVDDVFLIRSVRMEEWGNAGATYSVSLCNSKVVGIIELLQLLLLKDRKQLTIDEDEVPNLIRLDNADIYIEEEIQRISPYTDYSDIEIEEIIRIPDWEAEFVLAPYFPIDDDDPKTPMIMDVSSYLY
jgi:hypothetical protein